MKAVELADAIYAELYETLVLEGRFSASTLLFKTSRAFNATLIDVGLFIDEHQGLCLEQFRLALTEFLQQAESKPWDYIGLVRSPIVLVWEDWHYAKSENAVSAF